MRGAPETPDPAVLHPEVAAHGRDPLEITADYFTRKWSIRGEGQGKVFCQAQARSASFKAGTAARVAGWVGLRWP